MSLPDGAIGAAQAFGSGEEVIPDAARAAFTLVRSPPKLVTATRCASSATTTARRSATPHLPGIPASSVRQCCSLARTRRPSPEMRGATPSRSG